MKGLEKRIVVLEEGLRPDVVKQGREIEAMLKAYELGFEALTPAEKAVLPDSLLRELEEIYEEYVENRGKVVRKHEQE